MIIGVPAEIKNSEYRVGLTPAAVKTLVADGNDVFVESGAGIGSGLHDEEYTTAGAELLSSPERVYDTAEMIVKVKEPVAAEYNLIRQQQIIFTYFHFAASRELTDAMLGSGATCVAYETVETPTGQLPLLAPMSMIAGRLSVQEGAKYLENLYGGRGVLLGGVPGVKPASVKIVGGGTAGMQAAMMAAGLRADVTVYDKNPKTLQYLSEVLPANVKPLYSDELSLAEAYREADLVIGAVLIHGAKTPRLLTKEHLHTMKPGALIVDVAIDQGGFAESSKPTTHVDPVYNVDNIVHYCVANMPGAVARTATVALSNATIPYVLTLAGKGLDACRENDELKKGLNIYDGRITCAPVAEAFGYNYVSADEVLTA